MIRLTEIRQGGATPTSFTYDASGNVESRQDGSLVTTYAFDPEHRLTWMGADGHLGTRRGRGNL